LAKNNNWNSNMQEYLLMSFITIGILFFLAVLAIYFGYSVRRDQLIVHNILLFELRDANLHGSGMCVIGYKSLFQQNGPKHVI
jgi:hypothetical protein